MMDELVGSILKNMTDASIAADRDWKLIYVNAEAEKLLGKERKELIGNNLWEIFSSALGESFCLNLHEEIASRSTFELEEWIPAHDRWLGVRIHPYAGGILCYFRDISALKQTEVKYRQVFETAREEIWMLDTRGRTDFINSRTAEMLGYAKEEMLGCLFFDFVEEAARRDAEDFWQGCQEGKKETRKFCFRHKNGAKIERLVSIESLREEGKTFLGALVKIVEARSPDHTGGAALDITEYKRIESALQQSEQQFRTTFEQAPIGIALIELDGRIRESNPALQETLGYTQAELQNQSFTNFAHPSEAKVDLKLYAKISRGARDRYQIVKRYIRKDERLVWARLNVALVRDCNRVPQFCIGMVEDITHQKKSEATKKRLHKERSARIEAEAARKRLAFLTQASTILFSSLDYETTLKSIAHLAIPSLADWCAIDLIDDRGQIQRVEVAHVDPDKISLARELYKRYPPEKNPHSSLIKVLKTGKSEWIREITDEMLVSGAIDAEHLQILRELSLKSCTIVPLVGRKEILGAISFVSAESEVRYEIEDLALAEELAYRAGMAIENARLYRQAQQLQQEAELAAERTTRLQAVTAALSQSLTPFEVAEVIAREGVAALNAASVFVALLDNSGKELETIRTLGYEEDFVAKWYRFPLDAPYPLSEAVRTGKAIWEESSQQRSVRYPHLREVYARYEDSAWISLPLIVEGRSIGGMSFSFDRTRTLKRDDRAFILALAQQCAQAISRTRLYEAEQAARATAEAASRLKEQFLSIVSHELRTPLNAILGWSQMLRKYKLDEASAAMAIETIERNAISQKQLIEDLLDLSRLVAGKLKLNRESIELGWIVKAAIEKVRSAAIAKNIQIQTQFDVSPIRISGDLERLQQIVWNLLSNAVKFTPPGGEIFVGISIIDSSASIRVSDTGAGIEPDFLPHVFDRFRQADSSITRSHGGLGLGLAIVRHLVEMHGGSVRADSEGKGKGATFTVNLPLTPASTNEKKNK